MRKSVTIAATGLALAVAGCGGGTEKAATNDSIVLADNDVATTPAPPEAAPGNRTAPAPTTAPDAGTGIPATLHGRWGLVPADCTSTRGDNKGLLTIDATTLRFYESVGTLGKVAERTANRIVADFAMTGEGQQWTRRMTLDTADNGKTLVRREQGADAMPEPLRYQKCA